MNNAVPESVKADGAHAAPPGARYLTHTLVASADVPLNVNTRATAAAGSGPPVVVVTLIVAESA